MSIHIAAKCLSLPRGRGTKKRRPAELARSRCRRAYSPRHSRSKLSRFCSTAFRVRSMMLTRAMGDDAAAVLRGRAREHRHGLFRGLPPLSGHGRGERQLLIEISSAADIAGLLAAAPSWQRPCKALPANLSRQMMMRVSLARSACARHARLAFATPAAATSQPERRRRSQTIADATPHVAFWAAIYWGGRHAIPSQMTPLEDAGGVATMSTAQRCCSKLSPATRLKLSTSRHTASSPPLRIMSSRCYTGRHQYRAGRRGFAGHCADTARYFISP